MKSIRTLKIGFLGLGNIGCGVFRILESQHNRIAIQYGIEFVCGRVLVRNPAKQRNAGIDASLLTTNPNDILLDSDTHIVIECMGGEAPAYEYIDKALRAGKSVVTANKEVMSKYGIQLMQTAHQSGSGLFFEASVCGGIPIIKILQEALQGNVIHEVKGIINGTTNYILTRMVEDDMSFDAALSQAQGLGYAEPNPESDISGRDAAYKLSILASLAFGTPVPVDQMLCEGISNIQQQDIETGNELGFALKLLSIAKQHNDGVEVRVHPAFIPKSHPLASVRNAYNAVFIAGDAVGELMLYGKGAGDMPTGSAIVSDLVCAASQLEQPKSLAQGMNQQQIVNDWECEYYIRLTARDQPGVLAKIASVFGIYQVSLASVIQKDHSLESVPLVFVTHMTSEKAFFKAMTAIADIAEVIRIDNIIRVER